LLAAAALLIVLGAGCGSGGKPEIAAGVDACASCNMVIDKVNEAAGFYTGKEFSAFCSPGCLLRNFEDMRKQKQTLPDRSYFGDYSGSGLQPADSTSFLITRHIPSVMGWGVIGFAGHEAAAAHKTHDDERVVDWIGLRTQKGTVDRKVSLVLTSAGMVPDVVEFEKGELVECAIEGRDLDRDLTIRLRGYEEVGEIHIPQSGEVVFVRILASRPGAGFPFFDTASKDVLGQIRVSGAHTREEEDM